MTWILIGIDFSECGHKALEAGLDLARLTGHGVRLVHAFPKHLQAPVTAGLGFQDLLTQYTAEAEMAEAVRLSTEFAEQARNEGVAVDVVAGEGPPEDLILKEAKRPDVTYVVVGSHGRSGFKKFVLGSVAQSVVQASPKPTLVVPAG